MVVLPAPLGPSRATVSPGGDVQIHAVDRVTDPKRFTSPSSAIIRPDFYSRLKYDTKPGPPIAAAMRSLGAWRSPSRAKPKPS